MAKPSRLGLRSGAGHFQSSPLPEFRETGCVTRLDAVPLRTSLKQGKRQKPVPHHRPALTGRKSSTGEFPFLVIFLVTLVAGLGRRGTRV